MRTLALLVAAFLLPLPSLAQEEEGAAPAPAAEEETPQPNPQGSEAAATEPDSPPPEILLSQAELWEAAFAAFREGQWQQAAEGFQQMLDQDPTDPRARSYLAECYLNLDDSDAAQAVLSQAPESAPPQQPTQNDPASSPYSEGAFSDDTPAPSYDPPPVFYEEEQEEEVEETDARSRWDGTHRSSGKLRRFGVALNVGGTAFGWGVPSAFSWPDPRTPPLAPGIAAWVRPIRLVSIQGGWGLSRRWAQSWWISARIHPIRGAASPIFGAGAVGEFGNYYHRVLWGGLESVVYPYWELGGAWTGPGGIHVEGGVDIVWNPTVAGQSQLWPFLRIGAAF